MEKEWTAKTGWWALLIRSTSTLLLARKISKSVQGLEKELAAHPGMDEEDVKRRWAELHRQNARLAHRHIIRYRGFLTKVGQAASMKAGDLPGPWVEELTSLQDELPISSIREVRRTVQTGLGSSLQHIFRDFDDRPIASASVAQAHVAHLRENNQKVCVKVQHRGVGRMVGTDLRTIDFICRRAAKYHTDAPDVTDLVREWRRASREEVDFVLEAKHAKRASAALKRARVDVSCPEPVERYCSRRVLTMAFIEGWKITDVERLPIGTDREALARPLVDAFAVLAFEEGLIHGDPHPGNVFAEVLDNHGGPPRLRASLLDWGIVQELQPKERVAAARWVMATLAQDRMLYFSALQELGFEFEDNFDLDVPACSTFLEASMGSCVWLLRDSIPSNAQLHFMEQLHKHQQQADHSDHDRRSEQAYHGKMVRKIPGVILFFLRGLEMLQNICGALEVVVPFSELVLRRAMPLLQAADARPSLALPAPAKCHQLELDVRTKLDELDETRCILGAQVAVLAGGIGEEQQWQCRVAVGKMGVASGPLLDSSLMPLLDVGIGVLLTLLLASLARPTVNGRQVTLDTPVPQIWPDFAQRDKGTITVGQLLQHRAGLRRVFPWDLTIKGFCNEIRMEQVLASAPRERDGAKGNGAGRSSPVPETRTESGVPPCRVVGCAAMAMMRRAMGLRSASDALRASLLPLGLHTEITYCAPEPRQAMVGRRPKESLSMERIYEWLEEKVEKLEQQSGKRDKPTRLTWQELATERPSCVDPLLVNRPSVRRGDPGLCVVGRGLRATAEALCKLLAADIIPGEMLNASLYPAAQLCVDSVEEWQELCGCTEIGRGGWQLMRFHEVATNKEVVGHGHLDGTTGSAMLRLPNHSVAVLLSSVDKETRHAGPAILETIAAQLGLTLVPREPPAGIPEKRMSSTPVASRGKAMCAGSTGSHREAAPECSSDQLAQIEAKVIQLSEAMERLLPGSCTSGALPDNNQQPTLEDEAVEQEHHEEESSVGLAGVWASAETIGLEELLDVFEVPSMVRAMVARARRSLRIQVEGELVTMSMQTSIAGRSVEDTTTQFLVGEPFEGEQAWGGCYHGLACWAKDAEDPSGEGEARKDVGRGVAADMRKSSCQPAGGHGARNSGDEGRGSDVDVQACRVKTGGVDVSQRAVASSANQRRPLLLEKRFQVERRTVVLQEHLSLSFDDQLALTTTVRAASEQRVPLQDIEEREIFCHCLDPQSLRLKHEIEMGGEYLWRGGFVVSCDRRAPLKSINSLCTMPVPGAVVVRYEDIQSTTTFNRQDSRPRATTSRGANLHAAPATVRDDNTVWPATLLSRTHSTNVQTAVREVLRMAASGCAVGIVAAGLVAGEICNTVCHTLGRALGAACTGCLSNKSDIHLRLRGHPRSSIAGTRETVEARGADMAQTPVAPGGVAAGDGIKASDLSPQVIQPSAPSQTDELSCAEGRTCSRCSFLNVATSSACAMCEAPLQAVSKADPRDADHVSAHDGASSEAGSCRQRPASSSAIPLGGTDADIERLPRIAAIDFAEIADPRSSQGSVEVVAILSIQPDDADKVRWGQLLNNSDDLGSDGLLLEAPCNPGRPRRFRNAEAAFQALQFWALAARFAHLSGRAARQKRERLGGHADSTYGGFGGMWAAMLAVLQAKFMAGTDAALQLVGTGDTFLLVRDVAPSREWVWSDGGDGEGKNWLGLQLLLIRDRLSGNGWWTAYAQRLLELETGLTRSPAVAQQWQDVVRSATAAVKVNGAR